jgi:hypothetical protein
MHVNSTPKPLLSTVCRVSRAVSQSRKSVFRDLLIEVSKPLIGKWRLIAALANELFDYINFGEYFRSPILDKFTLIFRRQLNFSLTKLRLKCLNKFHD